MKVEKAIEILTMRIRIREPLKNPDYEDALTLAIEALNFVECYRKERPLTLSQLLPGETL